MSEKIEPRDIYAARLPGWPGFVAVMVDDPKWRKDTAKDLADWAKQGYEIERVTRSESIAGFNEYAAEKKRRAANAPEIVGPLFEMKATAEVKV